MKLRGWLVAAAIVSVGSLPPFDAAAQSSDPAAATKAVDLGREAIALYEDGQWAEALPKFEEAERLFHSPVFLLYAARCKRALGKLLTARDHYDAVIAESVPDNAPPPWRQAQLDAKGERAALAQDIPTVTVELKNATSNVKVFVDNKSIDWRQPVDLDPGDHTLRAEDGETTRTIQIKASVGDRLTETFDFAVSGSVEEVLPPPAEDAHSGNVVDGGGPNTLGIIALAVGGAGLIGGGVVGGLALSASSDAETTINDLCGGSRDRCPSSAQTAVEDEQASVNGLADVSTVLFIGGGIIAAAGVVLLLTDPGGGEPTAFRVTPQGVGFTF